MKSSFSGANGGNCVEVTKTIDEKINISETDFGLNGAGHHDVLTTKENFAAFIKGVKAGEFDSLLD